MTHEEAVERYFAAIYPNDEHATLTPELKEELRSLISDIYDLRERLEDLAEDAGNTVFLSASAKIDEALRVLDVFDVGEEEEPAPRTVNDTVIEINDDELPF